MIARSVRFNAFRVFSEQGGPAVRQLMLSHGQQCGDRREPGGTLNSTRGKVESNAHHNGSDQIGQQALLWGHEAEGGAGGSSALGPSSLQRSSAAISSTISSATL